jgi:hypothetical protein
MMSQHKDRLMARLRYDIQVGLVSHETYDASTPQRLVCVEIDVARTAIAGEVFGFGVVEWKSSPDIGMGPPTRR